jgi:histidinol-phosphate aminotransferase
MFTAGQQTAFLDKVPSDILVVLDEAYYEYVKNEEYPNSLDMLSKYPNLIILRTFSKAYGLASLRIGYGIASQEIIELLNRIRNPFNVTTSAQEAAIASLNDKDFVAMTAENNLKVKLYIYEQFEKMGLPYISTEGNFIMIDTKKDSKEMFEKLLREGIVVRPGFYFGMDTWLRVTIGTKEQMEMFMKALSRLI